MGPYSTDFRRSIVRAYERGEGSQRQLARLFGASVSFVQNLLQRYRRTGSVEPLPHRGGNPGKITPHLAVVKRLRQQVPDAPLADMCERFAAEVQVRVSPTTMCRALRQLGAMRKTPQKRRSVRQSKTTPKASTHARRAEEPSA
jgi:transposase